MLSFSLSFRILPVITIGYYKSNTMAAAALRVVQTRDLNREINTQ